METFGIKAKYRGEHHFNWQARYKVTILVVEISAQNTKSLNFNKNKDWALVQTMTLVIEV